MDANWKEFILIFFAYINNGRWMRSFDVYTMVFGIWSGPPIRSVYPPCFVIQGIVRYSQQIIPENCWNCRKNLLVSHSSQINFDANTKRRNLLLFGNVFSQRLIDTIFCLWLANSLNFTHLSKFLFIQSTSSGARHSNTVSNPLA